MLPRSDIEVRFENIRVFQQRKDEGGKGKDVSAKVTKCAIT